MPWLKIFTSLKIFYTHDILKLYTKPPTFSPHILIFQLNVASTFPIKTKLQISVERQFGKIHIKANKLPNWISPSFTSEILKDRKTNNIQFLLRLVSVIRLLFFNLELCVLLIQSTVCWWYVFYCENFKRWANVLHNRKHKSIEF